MNKHQLLKDLHSFWKEIVVSKKAIPKNRVISFLLKVEYFLEHLNQGDEQSHLSISFGGEKTTSKQMPIHLLGPNYKKALERFNKSSKSLLDRQKLERLRDEIDFTGRYIWEGEIPIYVKK